MADETTFAMAGAANGATSKPMVTNAAKTMRR